MKHVQLLSTGVLLVLLGIVAPALAQERHEQQAEAPKQEQAKPEKQEKPEQQSQAKGKQDQQKAQQQQSKTQQKQQAQQSQAKGKQDQQKAQQQQAKGQQDKQQPQQQSKTVSRQEGASQHPQRTPEAQSKQRSEPALRLSARGQGRIPDDRFRSNFGQGHRFSIGSPRMVDGYSRFQYGGFWFGFVQPWPEDWYYTDDVYIDYIDGEYFVLNPYYPGVRIAISVVP